MTDIGIEFAVALDQRGELVVVVVQRGGQLADFVVGEMRPQRLGLAGPAHRLHARGKIGDRAHHPRRQPAADQQ